MLKKKAAFSRFICVEALHDHHTLAPPAKGEALDLVLVLRGIRPEVLDEVPLSNIVGQRKPGSLRDVEELPAPAPELPVPELRVRAEHAASLARRVRRRRVEVRGVEDLVDPPVLHEVDGEEVVLERGHRLAVQVAQDAQHVGLGKE